MCSPCQSTLLLNLGYGVRRNDFLENTAADSQGGAGVKAAQLLVDQHVDVLITPRCGQNAAEVLTAAKMEIYKTEYPSAKENLTAFKSGLLAVLSDFHAGFHGHVDNTHGH